MLGAAMRRANVQERAMDLSVRIDVPAQCLFAVAQLREPTSQNVVLGKPSKFRKYRRNGLEHLVGNFRLPGLLGAFLGNPTARFEQSAELLARIQVRVRELLG